MARVTGKVKWFNTSKGYGFIALDGESKDVFVHYSGISQSGYKSLNEGDSVEFDITNGAKGPQAVDVAVLVQAPVKPLKRKD